MQSKQELEHFVLILNRARWMFFMKEKHAACADVITSNINGKSHGSNSEMV